MLLLPVEVTFIALCTLGTAAPTPESDAKASLFAVSPYAPQFAQCPNMPLVQPATKIDSREASYVSSRKSNADKALSSWLKKRGRFDTSSLPVVGFTSSGGGYRSLLETAGVVQGFDIRDSDVGTSGLYQSLIYQAGLSGGSWFLSSLASNNWPTVSSLQTILWEPAFDNSLLVPPELFSISGLTQYPDVKLAILAKEVAGYPTTTVDAYGRLLSYQLLDGNRGGITDRLSGLTSLSNFQSYSVPFPIMTTTTNFPNKGECYPSVDGPIFEFNPYTYGSWDAGISAFADTKYMGSDLTNGKPTRSGECTKNYDNIGYIFGTSSDVFNGVCQPIQPSNNTNDLGEFLEGFVAVAHDPVLDDLFGIYKNPFYHYSRSSMVKDNRHLYISDGGLANQNIPIWPFIQPQRSVDVLVVNDNSADTDDNFPDGSGIRQTYVNAQATGLSKMPFIPEVDTFISEGLNKRATFFGCDEPDTMFVVYLPNVNYTYPSNQPTSKLEYGKKETDAMISNGLEIATQNGDEQWPMCLACAIKNSDGERLRRRCKACFEKYCYRQ